MSGLLHYRSNTYSQNGEDGVIQEILTRTGMDNVPGQWCVEFGAWDGMHLSNTFRLVEQAGWNAVYIEGDPQRFSELLELSKLHERVTPINAMVSSEATSAAALDALLKNTQLPNEYGLLSIDVDSNDLCIWETHVDYRPRVVVIEVNSSIPPGRMQVHGHSGQGNSFSAMVELGLKKGYVLVCHTGNATFVDETYVHLLSLPDALLRNPSRSFLPFALPRWHSTRLIQSLRRVVGDSTI